MSGVTDDVLMHAKRDPCALQCAIAGPAHLDTLQLRKVQGDLDGALAALKAAADLAAPISSAETVAAAPVETFTSRPRRPASRKQQGKAAASGAKAGDRPGDLEVASSMRNDSTSVGSIGSNSVLSGGSAHQSQGGSGKETAVRALLAAGSMLARAGRKEEAVEAVRRAVALDSRLQPKFLEPLEQELQQ